MHVVFVHQNFPAQFGHIAAYLAKHKGFRCTFVTQRPSGTSDGIERIQYKLKGGATKGTHYCSRTFENAVWHSHGVFEALEKRPDIRPDLIVAHSGFGSTIFLRELYDVPIINYFEYYYHSKGSDIDFRPEFPTTQINLLRSHTKNAMILLDLDNCDVGYSPTTWQRNRLPRLFHERVRTIFDGIDTTIWKPVPNLPRVVGDKKIPDHMKVITYVSRGFESMRGFDIFMKTAKKICDMRKDVIFIVIGEDRICYGGDERYTNGKSYKEHVLSQDNYDLSRILFVGRVHPLELAKILAWTDLHIYLTVPFVLSWSLMDTLACGATVLASNTAPVREMVQHNKNGLLADFYDVDGFVRQANSVLDAPKDFKHLGKAAVEMIQNKYSLDVCLPQMLKLYEDAVGEFKEHRAAP